MGDTPHSTGIEQSEYVNRLAHEVASICGFEFVPPVHLRRGRGGDWNPMNRRIRIGRGELRGDQDHLWYIMAHELAHAQAERKEGHPRAFWVRLANGLEHAGRLELLRYDFGYREAALRISEDYSVPNVPRRREFRVSLGAIVEDSDGRGWKVVRRFRHAGTPYYRLETRGWRWTTSEQVLLL